MFEATIHVVIFHQECTFHVLLASLLLFIVHVVYQSSQIVLEFYRRNHSNHEFSKYFVVNVSGTYFRQSLHTEIQLLNRLYQFIKSVYGQVKKS